LKKLLITHKNLKENQVKNIRFIRNYDIFKNTLLTQKKVQFPVIPILLGNKQSKTNITIVTNPFCGHCKKAHEILDEILENHNENVLVQIILKVDLEHESEDNIKLYRNLYALNSTIDKTIFTEALKNWFEETNLQLWLEKYEITVSSQFDEVIKSHFEWSVNNQINFTPAIFINRYQYPDVYDRDNLKYFINDLIEDEDFYHQHE
jgi:thiol-disulfide isomerase/thioredoxin